MTQFPKDVVRLDEAIPARGFLSANSADEQLRLIDILCSLLRGDLLPRSAFFHRFIHVTIAIKMKLSTIQRTTCFSLIGIPF